MCEGDDDQTKRPGAAGFVLYVFSLCRPVLMEGLVRDAGLKDVSRTFLDGVVASEIVTAVKAVE
jgi:hypothetical protein